MLQDFNFQIVHHLGSMHTNADILSKNPMEGVNDDDFQSEIEDCIWTTGWCEWKALDREKKLQDWSSFAIIQQQRDV